MSSRSVDFVIGSTPVERNKKSANFDICYAYPRIENTPDTSSIVRSEHIDPRSHCNEDEAAGEAPCASMDAPLTSGVVKPYRLASLRKIAVASSPVRSKKLLEICAREVKIHRSFNGSQAPIQISAIAVFFKDKAVCKISSPFNRKLYKVLFTDDSENSDFSVQLHSAEGTRCTLPLPLPRLGVKDFATSIDFSVQDGSGRIHSGVATFSLTLTARNTESEKSSVNGIGGKSVRSKSPGAPASRTEIRRSEAVDYFLLYEPALCFGVATREAVGRKRREEVAKSPEVVVSERVNLSSLGLSLGRFFQARRPLRPSSAGDGRKLCTGREEIVRVTVLRAVEVPVREESALVQPSMEIRLGAECETTRVADGPAPVWQQTVELVASRRNEESQVRLTLYDQHPIWGLQWLGEAAVPLEFHRNYQQFERWIGLAPLASPVVRFGYVQPSPALSYTRIYVMMKMERPGNIVKMTETNSTDQLAKSIQRCLSVPYKIPGIETPKDCAKLAMLLNPLPNHYGPLPARQALKLNKIDDYGRAALLATLLQGLGLDAYVLIGSSQAKKWAPFVVSFDDRGTSPRLWDPENGENYDFGDSRCSLIKSSRIINHEHIWKNMQKSTAVPFNLRFNPKSNKDWQPLPTTSGTATATPSNVVREIQVLELGESTTDAEQQDAHLEIERHLREKLSAWRCELALTTIFNRHAVTIVRSYLGKFNARTDCLPDKKELRPLYRAYHMRGFVINLRRETPIELADRLFSTRIHEITGPVEFALVCRIERHVGKTCSVWLAVVVLRVRD